jgi:hypothetical protein
VTGGDMAKIWLKIPVSPVRFWVPAPEKKKYFRRVNRYAGWPFFLVNQRLCPRRSSPAPDDMIRASLRRLSVIQSL